jgi:hypothetical protein
MVRPLAQTQPASAPAGTLRVDLARIRAMNIDQLRAAWREAFASDPLLAFSKDLLARAIAFHAQQEAVGAPTTMSPGFLPAFSSTCFISPVAPPCCVPIAFRFGCACGKSVRPATVTRERERAQADAAGART